MKATTPYSYQTAGGWVWLVQIELTLSECGESLSENVVVRLPPAAAAPPYVHSSIYCAVRVVLNARLPSPYSLPCAVPVLSFHRRSTHALHSCMDRCLSRAPAPHLCMLVPQLLLLCQRQQPTRGRPFDRSRSLLGFVQVQNVRSSFRVRRSETGLCMVSETETADRVFRVVWNRAWSHLFQVWETIFRRRRIVSAGKAKTDHH